MREFQVEKHTRARNAMRGVQAQPVGSSRILPLAAILIVALLAFACTGCAVCETHPTACRVAAGVAVVVVVGAATAYGVKHAHVTSASSSSNSGLPPAPPPPTCQDARSCAT